MINSQKQRVVTPQFHRARHWYNTRPRGGYRFACRFPGCGYDAPPQSSFSAQAAAFRQHRVAMGERVTGMDMASLSCRVPADVVAELDAWLARQPDPLAGEGGGGHLSRNQWLRRLVEREVAALSE
jgi:hypothetical protein